MFSLLMEGRWKTVIMFVASLVAKAVETGASFCDLGRLATFAVCRASVLWTRGPTSCEPKVSVHNHCNSETPGSGITP